LLLVGPKTVAFDKGHRGANLPATPQFEQPSPPILLRAVA
jgi:hypothetical protein